MDVLLISCPPADWRGINPRSSRPDPPLSTDGEKLACKLASSFVRRFGDKPWRLLHGPEARAKTTAHIFEEHAHRVRLYEEADLADVNIGTLQGLTAEERRRQYPEAHFRLEHPDFNFTEVRGESARHMIHRHVRRFASYEGAEPVAAVVHGRPFDILTEIFLPQAPTLAKPDRNRLAWIHLPDPPPK